MTLTEIFVLAFVIIVYISWALVNGLLARRRNHSFAAWVGISICIMPPFAMIAMLILCKPDNNHLIP